MENYIILEMIGEGAFGKVYKGQRKCTNQIVAIKKIIKKGKKEKELKNLRQEIDILHRLYHENIIQCLDSFETNSEFCLVTELGTGQLYEIIQEDKKLPEKQIKEIALQLTSALFYLHNNNIIHRDIKPQNVLISASGIIKICDFGFARAIDNKTMITSIKGTPLYMAPELLKEYPYNKKADLWSLGVILYELYVGQPPFYTNNFQTLLHKIAKEEIRYPDSMSSDFKDFLKGLLVKNPKDRWDWPKILQHPFLKENEAERKAHKEREENYHKWILRIKNDKIFNLFESESFLAKFANDMEVENNTKDFSSFDTINEKQSMISNTSKKTSSTKAPEDDEDSWTVIENKSNTDEGATSLRKDPAFAEKVYTTLKSLIKDDQIVDKKLAITIINILYNILTKGKFDTQNIDITKNQNILTMAINMFRITQDDNNQNQLLNGIIKVIGLFIKFYCFFSGGIDLSICSGFLRYVPNVLNVKGRPPNLYINMLKAVGLMITAANISPKRSLLFYKSIIDFNIVHVLFKVSKNYANQSYILTKSCLECLGILIHPINGEIHSFPFLRNEAIEQRFEGYNEVKTAFSYIDLLKKHFFTICKNENIFEILPKLYDLENEIGYKNTILKLMLQLFRYNSDEMTQYFLNKSSPYPALINKVINCDDVDKKPLTQIGLLILIEVVKYCNKKNININELTYYDIQKGLSYINKTFQTDITILCLSFGLLAECLSSNSNYYTMDVKILNKLKEMIRNSRGRGRDENKKLEGTQFGYLNTAILDYLLFYLEKIVLLMQQKERYKTEIMNAIKETQFEDALVEIISNFSYKNEISQRGIASSLNIIYQLINADYKMILRKVIREHCMKQLIILLKKKQFIAIQEWPGYPIKEGTQIAISILTNTLKIIKIAADLNGITENIIGGDFFMNLKNAFDVLPKENHKIVMTILNSLISSRHDGTVGQACFDYFSKFSNLKFIDTYNMLKDTQNKELIIEVLLFLSSLCRKSRDVYQTVDQLNILNDLIKLLECNETGYKSRVCNLLGNMCRHNEFFYEKIKSCGILSPLLKCCYDNDKATRKFACFAIGNAAFLNDSLYESFRPIIPRMVELLKDQEDNTRANSAGALGNFVRCGDQLAGDLVKNKAHEALLQLAETQDMPQIQVIRVALFALGNFCNNSMIKSELEKINFRQRIEVLKSKFSNDKQLLEHIERIRKKLNN